MPNTFFCCRLAMRVSGKNPSTSSWCSPSTETSIRSALCSWSRAFMRCIYALSLWSRVCSSSSSSFLHMYGLLCRHDLRAFMICMHALSSWSRARSLYMYALLYLHDLEHIHDMYACLVLMMSGTFIIYTHDHFWRVLSQWHVICKCQVTLVVDDKKDFVSELRIKYFDTSLRNEY